jgi:methylenetetrahydrofolate dehydrogenase (NADP+)/methenyltetrahydrofolate cyclohydrolase
MVLLLGRRMFALPGAPTAILPRLMIIDGKQVAAKVRAEVADLVREMTRQGLVPGLTVVRVGDDPASAVYVRGKRKACEEVGMRSVEHHLPATVGEAELLDLVARLNGDPETHGILVQLPLPKQIDESKVLDAISPAKDADGFHPVNVGALWLGKPAPRPCTPAGVMRLLDEAGVDPRGKRALVIGRSHIVGKPMAAMLLDRHATVTVAHSRTEDLAGEVGRADILVAAIGKAEMVKGAWVKPGAVVIDVGMNRKADGKLCGDVEFAEAEKRAGAITPVPGGVGPMTIAMLLVNTLALARRAR